MQNIIPIVSSNDAKVIKQSQKNITAEDLPSNSNDSKGFVSVLFDQIKEKSEKIDTKSKKIEPKSIDLTNLDDISKSTDELLLNEILNIVDNINSFTNNDKQNSFPKFSDKLKSVLNTQESINDFKNIKSMDDIVKFSEKYNLNLEKLDITQESIDKLKETFPKLQEKGFFEIEDNSQISKIINRDTIPKQQSSKRVEDINRMLRNLSQDKNLNDNKSSTQVLQNLLKNVDESSKKVIYKSVEEDKKEKVKDYIKKTDTKITEEKGEITIKSDNKEKSLVKNDNKINQNSIKSQTSDISKTVASNSQISTNIDKNLNIKDTKKEKENSLKTKLASKEESKNIPKHQDKVTLVDETKEEKLQTTQKQEDDILQKIKSSKQVLNQNLNQEVSNSKSRSKKDTDSEIKVENRDLKNDNQSTRAEIKTTHKVDIAKPNQNIQQKETFNNFANDLKEKMDQYKPPIMKVQMALNPKNLGEVEVTILNRGNNLHVNITSNTNTMSLFTQNQAEFKNSLVNMGFTNLEMNFSDQREGNKEQQRGNSSNKEINEELEQGTNEDISSINLIVPRYI